MFLFAKVELNFYPYLRSSITRNKINMKKVLIAIVEDDIDDREFICSASSGK